MVVVVVTVLIVVLVVSREHIFNNLIVPCVFFNCGFNTHTIFGGRESWIVFSAFYFNKIKRKSDILENKRVKLPELAKLFVGSLKLAVYVVVIKF